MRIKAVQEIIDILRGKKHEPEFLYEFSHRQYGKIYMPYYNIFVKMLPDEPEIYNKEGFRMRTFFIRDIHFAHAPVSKSKYFIWDRFNIGLNTYFYSHGAMLETMGNPDKRYGMLVESQGIVPGDYKIFEKNKGLNKDFDLIFTYSADILEKYDNARFVPFCAEVWNQNYIDSEAYKHKTKNVSILSSNKLMCDLHKFRYETALRCKREGLADTFGTFDGGNMCRLTDTLNDYRFSICIENDISPFFFTERLTTALACGTIPIYLGASEIDKFFNPDGIIKITKSDDIKEVLKQCTKEEYENRISAVIDNMERAKKYYRVFDFMAENHLKSLFDRNFEGGEMQISV